MTTTWKEKISLCFGNDTSAFGVHPTDRKFAEEMLRAAFIAGVDFEHVVREVRRWMKRRKTVIESIDQEIAQLRKFHPNPFNRQKPLKSTWVVTWEKNKTP